MPNPDAAPQTPGKMSVDLTPGHEKIDIDGYRIEQHVSAIKLTYDAAKRRPVLSLELLPSAVDVTASHVMVTGPFRDFLLAHGWSPPQ